MKSTSTFNYVLTLLLLVGISACSKEGSNDLGGEVDIPLTKKDSVTAVAITVNGQYFDTDARIKVKSNDEGIVVYEGTIDLKGLPDSTKFDLVTKVPAMISYYSPGGTSYTIGTDTVLTFQFKVKVTSKGILNYFVDGKPWVVGKYDDGQGTEYKLKRDNGDELVATITEKTGLDDWPFGFFNIKTSKIEFDTPDSDPVLDKVIYRINHRFGVVYIEMIDKNGETLELDMFPLFPV